MKLIRSMALMAMLTGTATAAIITSGNITLGENSPNRNGFSLGLSDGVTFNGFVNHPFRSQCFTVQTDCVLQAPAHAELNRADGDTVGLTSGLLNISSFQFLPVGTASHTVYTSSFTASGTVYGPYGNFGYSLPCMLPGNTVPGVCLESVNGSGTEFVFVAYENSPSDRGGYYYIESTQFVFGTALSEIPEPGTMFLAIPVLLALLCLGRLHVLSRL